MNVLIRMKNSTLQRGSLSNVAFPLKINNKTYKETYIVRKNIHQPHAPVFGLFLKFQSIICKLAHHIQIEDFNYTFMESQPVEEVAPMDEYAWKDDALLDVSGKGMKCLNRPLSVL